MISFTCDKCSKAFKVPDDFAGRSAKCKICGNPLIVPGVAAAVAPQPVVPEPAPVKIPMRTRRLRADAQAMSTIFAGSAEINVKPLAGDPPESYRITYNIESLQPGADGKPIPRDEHQVEIQLTSDYPRLSPSCKIMTPIFHPNFDASTICVGDHWTAGERLVDLVVRIGEMIAFQAYNIQSPLDAQAAMWADLNRGLLPTDQRNLHPPEL
jgi:ubiquitin-protein ligase